MTVSQQVRDPFKSTKGLPDHFFHSNPLFFQVPFNFESLLPYMNYTEPQVVAHYQNYSEGATIIKGASCHKAVLLILSEVFFVLLNLESGECSVQFYQTMSDAQASIKNSQ